MGISLAAICAVLGYRLILTMPDTAAVEHRKILSAYGAELVLTPAEEGMKGAIDNAEEIYKNHSDCFMPHQFINSSNPEAHEKTTAREIWADTRGEITALVGGIGTGGTITGIGRYLKKQNDRIKIYGVEPEASAVLSGGKAGSHGIPGIGAGFIPETLNRELIDTVVAVSDDDAKQMCRELAQKEGILAGISSGAVCSAALQILDKEKESLIVAVFPDSGTKYINMGLFA
jgi:cysteine synthase A